MAGQLADRRVFALVKFLRERMVRILVKVAGQANDVVPTRASPGIVLRFSDHNTGSISAIRQWIAVESDDLLRVERISGRQLLDQQVIVGDVDVVRGAGIDIRRSGVRVADGLGSCKLLRGQQHIIYLLELLCVDEVVT